jgi:hypothetical protein
MCRGARPGPLWSPPVSARPEPLAKGTAFYRKTAADLVRRFPEIVEPLRDGRLCITSVVQLAKLLTPESRRNFLPRFFHRSKREAWPSRPSSARRRPPQAAPLRLRCRPGPRR